MHEIPVLLRQLEQPPARADPGAVDEDVDAPERIQHLAHDARDAGAVGQVVLQRQRLAGERLGGRGAACGALAVAVQHRHACAAARQLLDRGRTDAGRAAGDERRLALQRLLAGLLRVGHGLSPPVIGGRVACRVGQPYVGWAWSRPVAINRLLKPKERFLAVGLTGLDDRP